MKKSLSIIASVALCFAFGVAAFAEEPVVLSNEEDVMLISTEEVDAEAPIAEEVGEVEEISEVEEVEDIEALEEELEEMTEAELIAYEAQVNEDKFIVILVVAISVAAIVAFNIIGNNLCVRKKR